MENTKGGDNLVRLKFWQRASEKRESQPFTDAVIQAIVSQAEGSMPGDPAATWALETAASLYSKAFAAARITGERTEKITPGLMALVARNLIRRGDSLHVIELRRGDVDFLPVGSWDVRGGWDETSWFYRADIFGPSGNITRLVSSGGVLHFRYAVDPARAWHGVGPLGWARETGVLAANLEKRLGEEAGGAVAHILPIPQDGGSGEDDDPLAMLKADLAGAKGKTILTETTSAAWGEGKSAAPKADWKSNRIGADPPDTLRFLRSESGMSVLSACGVPPGLASAGGTAQGAREDWRRFVTGSIEPALALVKEELEKKLETQVSFDLKNLWAHDLQGRASAFQKLIAGGMPLEQAVAASGVLSDG